MPMGSQKKNHEPHHPSKKESAELMSIAIRGK